MAIWQALAKPIIELSLYEFFFLKKRRYIGGDQIPTNITDKMVMGINHRSSPNGHIGSILKLANMEINVRIVAVIELRHAIS
ncbi:MAG: hypothetical protein F4044_05620 [Rhodobacteraceae bacterium]|nr:hypothetical protein [Paracoccaceae bacterium]